MNKVWVVETVNEDYSEIFKIRSTSLKAQLVKMQLIAEISSAKVKYNKLYDSSYDQDWELVSNDNLLMTDEKKYDELIDRLYTHKMRNEVLKITDIIISEHDVV